MLQAFTADQSDKPPGETTSGALSRYQRQLEKALRWRRQNRERERQRSQKNRDKKLTYEQLYLRAWKKQIRAGMSK